MFHLREKSRATEPKGSLGVRNLSKNLRNLYAGKPLSLKRHAQSDYRGNSVLQRLILTQPDPDRVDQALDFTHLASKLLSEETGQNVVPIRMFKGVNSPGTVLAVKDTLYVVAHGNSDSIVGFSSGYELGAALGQKGISKKNTSKIVLVSCSTGNHSAQGNPTNFAQDLTKFMGIDVYAASSLIYVSYTLPKYGDQIPQPTGFTVKGIKVGVVEGDGLIRFTPDGKGYIPIGD